MNNLLKQPWREQASGRAAYVSRCLYRRWGIALVVSLVLTSHSRATDVITAYVLGGQPEATYRQNLETQAARKVDTARVACGLSPEATEKLRQAALGDVARALHELRALRHVTEDLDMTDPMDNQTGSKLVQPFLTRVRTGLHGPESLFAKYLEHALDQSQKDTYQQYLAEKEKERQHLITLNAVVAIDQRMPLLKAQREKLVELMDRRPLPQVFGFSDSLFGFLKLSQIPESELSTFLDAEQTRYVLKICEPYQAILRQQR